MSWEFWSYFMYIPRFKKISKYHVDNDSQISQRQEQKLQIRKKKWLECVL